MNWFEISQAVVFANSRDVAAYFGKEHKNVLRDIDEVIETQAAQNWAAWFIKSYHEVNRTGRGTVKYPAYDMTRDGFTLRVTSPGTSTTSLRPILDPLAHPRRED